MYRASRVRHTLSDIAASGSSCTSVPAPMPLLDTLYRHTALARPVPFVCVCSNKCQTWHTERLANLPLSTIPGEQISVSLHQVCSMAHSVHCRDRTAEMANHHHVLCTMLPLVLRAETQSSPYAQRSCNPHQRRDEEGAVVSPDETPVRVGDRPKHLASQARADVGRRVWWHRPHVRPVPLVALLVDAVP